MDVEKVHDRGEMQLEPRQLQEVAAAIAAVFSLNCRTKSEPRCTPKKAAPQLAGATPSPPPAPGAKTEASSAAPTGGSRGAPPGGGDGTGHHFSLQFVVPQLPPGVGTPAATSGDGKATRTAKAKGVAPQPCSDGSAPAPKAAAMVAARGRKKRGLIKEVVRVSGEFAVATCDNPTFFGTGAKAMLLWMARLQKDFAERQDERASETEYVEHEKYGKVATVISRIMRAAKQHATGSDPFAKELGEVYQFMNLSPQVAEAILPEFVRTTKTKSALAQVEPGPAFWKLLSKEGMSADALSLASSKVLFKRDHRGQGRGAAAAEGDLHREDPGLLPGPMLGAIRRVW